MGSKRIKFLSDHNVPAPVISWLRTLNRIEVATAQELGLADADDRMLMKCATERKRVLLAADKGFSEHNYTVCTHPGIVNISRFNTRPSTCKDKLSRIFRKARRLLDHNVIHVGERTYWVVEVSNRRREFRYK